MNPRAIFFAAVFSAPLWALVYMAAVLVPNFDLIGGLLFCLTAIVLLAWGIRKELSS